MIMLGFCWDSAKARDIKTTSTSVLSLFMSRSQGDHMEWFVTVFSAIFESKNPVELCTILGHTSLRACSHQEVQSSMRFYYYLMAVNVHALCAGVSSTTNGTHM